ncbi:MAG: acetylglutamate kinase [Clostridiales Family XIII bacterium]|jgi:acetylglutamate kinase|nr:acetylglutamate kinase [Clostridiales Family XIII bacterium]
MEIRSRDEKERAFMEYPDGGFSLAEAELAVRPYIGKDVVVKYGGAAMTDGARKDAVMREVALLSRLGVRITLVHGGGPEIDAMLRRVGKAPAFIDGLRYTDAETMELVCMVLAGKVNKGLVGLLCAAGGKAVGLCGADGAMLRVRKRRGEPELGFVGEIERTDASLLEMLLSRGFVPVVATIGADARGRLFNINADTAAAALAGALRAEKLILMTDVRGVLADPDDADSLLETLHAGEAQKLIARGVVRGGMIPKLLCCAAAVEEGGLKEAAVIDGRAPRALLRALSSDGGGTRIVRRNIAAE